MSSRIPWNQQEAVLLVDTYIQVRDGVVPRKEAVSRLSKLLREYGASRGIEVDEIYRNENGISMQLAQIDGLFRDEEGRLSNVSKLFVETVTIYRNDKTRFDGLLADAKSVINSLESDKKKGSNDLEAPSIVNAKPEEQLYKELCISSQQISKGSQTSEVKETVNLYEAKAFGDMAEEESETCDDFSEEKKKEAINGEYDKNATFAELFGISPEDCVSIRLAKTSLSPRAKRCLRKKNIRTTSRLLQVNSKFLIGIQGFGSGSLNEVYSFLSSLPRDEHKEKNWRKYDEDASFAEVFGLSPERYTHIKIVENLLPERVVRRVRQEGIETLSEFLNLNNHFLVDLGGIGQITLHKVHSFLESLANGDIVELQERDDDLNHMTQGKRTCDSDAQKKGEIQRNIKYDEKASLAKLFGLKSGEYSHIRITEPFLSKGVAKRLQQVKIRTADNLLAVNSRSLMELKGFGQTSLSEIYRFVASLPKEEQVSTKDERGRTTNPTAAAVKHREQIFSGDFSFLATEELSVGEKERIRKYQDVYEMIGSELVGNCLRSPEYILTIIQALYQYSEETDRNAILKKLVNQIPFKRRSNRCKGYIVAFSFDDAICKKLYQCYSNEDASLDSIIDFIDIGNDALFNIASAFLKWCTFDLSSEISEMFCRIYASERTKSVIEARVKQHTLEEIGENLQVTRERVRQIELKARTNFMIYQTQGRIFEKIHADYNGKGIVTQEEIREISGENANALIYMLKNTESSIYMFDEKLNAFIIGETDILARIQDYIDSLPEIFHRKKLQEFLELANADNIDPKYAKKAIDDTYRLTGDIYHKSRLSLAKIYEEILRTCYPEGIHVSDDHEIDKFREVILGKYGDIGLPENNRAIAARISNIGVLAGRGKYLAKRKHWISKDLQDKLINYIEESNSPILMIGSIFYEYEDELRQEGVDNRYFLQGILHEIAGDKFYFRRDYVSKDKNTTSMYSSIAEYIKKSRYPVSKREIQVKFPGITDIMLIFAIKESDVLNYFGEYLHGSQLVIYDNEKKRLFEQLRVLTGDGCSHHIRDIYPKLVKENPEAFSRNAVSIPFQAYSVLEYLFEDEFQFSRPYVAKIGVEIGRASERLHEEIYNEDEYMISDIRDFAKENHFQIHSILEYVNTLNDRFLMRDAETIVSIDLLDITEKKTKEVQDIILQNISETTPIRDLKCFEEFPSINGSWTEWLVYSSLLKWGDQIDVGSSSLKLGKALPLVSPKGQMNTKAFEDMLATPLKVKIDDMDDIDEILTDIITEDMLEDI